MPADSEVTIVKSNPQDFEIKKVEPGIASVNRFFLVVLLLMLVFGSIAQGFHFKGGLLFSQWVIVLLPAIWYWKRYGLIMPRLVPLKSKYLPTLLVLSVSAFFLNMTFALLLIEFLMYFGFEPIALLPIPETLGQLGVYLFIIAFTAGVCEEVLFRGTIMPSLERYGQVPALVFSSLLFALMHLSFTNLVGTFFVGLLFGVVVMKSGSLLAGMVLHMLNNAFAMVFLYGVGDVEVGLESLAPAFYLLPVAALAGLIYGLLKLQRQSGAKPLLQNRKSWFPRGWPTVAFFAALFIFLCMAMLEMLLGFGFF